jgi:hypothetical protein
MEENYVKMASQDEIAQINETIGHIIKDMTFLTNVVVAMQNQINVLEQRINRCYH